MEDWMPGDAEAAAAKAALSGIELATPTITIRHGQPFDVWPIGGRVRFIDTQTGQIKTGVIVESLDDDEAYRVKRHVPDVGPEEFIVSRTDILES